MSEQVLLTAVQSLVGLIREVPQERWDLKAQAIYGFATRISWAVLERIGVDPEKDRERWENNQLASADAPDCEDNLQDEWIATLRLNRIPSTLDRKQGAELSEKAAEGGAEAMLSHRLKEVAHLFEHTFIFYEGRVVEWDVRAQKARRVLTYEETARFVVFWFAERIIQIIRKNEFDRVSRLPDLFDRLASLIAA